MNRRSADAINQVGQFYMKNLSEQISLHFQTTIGLRLEQVEALGVTDVVFTGRIDIRDYLG